MFPCQTMQLKKSGGLDYSQQKEKKGKFAVEVRWYFFYRSCLVLPLSM